MKLVGEDARAAAELVAAAIAIAVIILICAFLVGCGRRQVLGAVHERAHGGQVRDGRDLDGGRGHRNQRRAVPAVKETP